MNNFKSKTMRAFFLVLWMPTALLAQETVTVEQALIKCKKLYPNDFEAKNAYLALIVLIPLKSS